MIERPAEKQAFSRPARPPAGALDSGMLSRTELNKQQRDSMESQNGRIEQRARVAKELGRRIRRQARGKWSGVQTAERNHRGYHVWRFRSGTGADERFLHVSHDAMEQTTDPSRLLYRQLRVGRWLDRLADGPDTALCLSRDGHVEPWSAE